jgi:group I intron endonuclease
MRETVYVITNTVNGMQYVGRTRFGLPHRWRDHVSAARRGISSPLYRAMREFGSEAFTVKPLERVKRHSDPAAREAYWIATLNTYQRGYNVTSHGGPGS